MFDSSTFKERRYELREPLEGDKLLEICRTAAQEMDLRFSTFKPRKPKTPSLKAIAIDKMPKSPGLLARLFRATQFSFLTSLDTANIAEELYFTVFANGPQGLLLYAERVLGEYMVRVYEKINQGENAQLLE